MTYEQAKERFKSFGTFCDDYNDACDGDCEMCSDMEDRILEALETQIPKKPDEVWMPSSDCARHIGKCPRCRASVFYGEDCKVCTMQIDWSEVE